MRSKLQIPSNLDSCSTTDGKSPVLGSYNFSLTPKQAEYCCPMITNSPFAHLGNHQGNKEAGIK
ncbi:MAG: hypothetical protein AAGF83_28165 [Cyanobacteria bacterium P01_G01_bin.67]